MKESLRMSEITIAARSANKDLSFFRTSDILKLYYILKLRVNPISIFVYVSWAVGVQVCK